MSNKIMSIKEVADYLRFSKHQIRVYCQKGLLKAHKVGEGKNLRWRIYEEDVHNFVNNKGG